MKLSKKFKKFYKYFLSVTVVGFTPIFLSACSTVSNDLIDSSISKANGDYFASGSSLNDVAKQALNNQTSATTFFDQQIGELVLSWYKKLSNTPDHQAIKSEYDAQVKSVDNDYDSTLKTSQDTNGANWPLKFQQEELDVHGGSVSSWKKEKMISWALNKFKTDVFNNFYFSIVDSNDNAINNPSTIQISNALANSSGKVLNKSTTKGSGETFGFSPLTIDATKRDNLIDKQYSDFQDFIYQEWIKSENPFIISLASWNYGTPTNGLDSLYTKDALGISSSNTSVSGSYQFPYFSSTSSSNTSLSTTQKFLNFVNEAKTKTNYIDNSVQDLENNPIGIVDIPTNFSDDTKQVFLTGSTIYSDSNINVNVAAAVSYLFGSSIKSSGINDIDSKIGKAITTNVTDGMDVITSNFVSKSAPTGFETKSMTKLSSSYMSSIINPNGAMKDLSSSDVYTLDAFKPNDTSNSIKYLGNFILLRDTSGVKAVTVDGLSLIKQADSLDNAKKLGANIVAYKYFMNNNFSQNNSFSVDLKSQLSTFFSNNFDYLVYKYATDSTTKSKQQMFNVDSVFVGNLQTLLNALSKYIYESSRYDRQQSYQDALFTGKNSYSSSYGVSAKKNGLASKWIYTYTEPSTNAVGIFDITKTVTITGVNDPYSTNGSWSVYLNTINSYIDSLRLSPLSSDFEGFKYSQYIYSNDYFVNEALLSIGNDSNSLGNFVKQKILLDYMGDKTNIGFNSDYKVTSSFFSNLTNWSQTSSNDNYTKSINNALNNEFFSSTFSNLTNKWTKYSNSVSDNKITQDNLNSYRLNLWKNENTVDNSTSSDNKISLLTLLATAKYLLSDDGANFLQYLKNQISVGTTAFVIWENSKNTTLQSNGTTATSDLLSDSNMYQNVNNSANSAYYTLDSNSNAVDKNNQSSAFNLTDKYYSDVANMVGFLGLQTKNASVASTLLQDRLFTNPTSYDATGNVASTATNGDPTGILFGYASSFDNFKNY
ncbi:MAG: hypothetical protein K2I67_00615, partial [Malacoplasma sp.]|nr:hypothetical protein [Malacoplasma sp.]